jgi:hypothetical protein
VLLLSTLRGRGARERERESAGRRRAAHERTQASYDRYYAARDRELGARDRQASKRDREAAGAAQDPVDRADASRRPSRAASPARCSEYERHMEMTSNAHDDAEVRLERALAAERRAGECYRHALGNANELETFIALRAANDEVAARQTWLAEVDKDSVGDRITVNGRPVGGAGSIFL